jgi:DNA replication protein DnaC
MSIVLLDQYLKRLRLPTVAKNYELVAKEAEVNRVAYEEYLCCLSEQEVQAREENTRKERLAKARFPSMKTLDQFKFDEIPALDKNLVMQLFNGQYLEAAENVVFLGGHGTGKSHLAISLGVEACAAGKRVRFYSVGDLVHQLLEARDARQVFRLQQQLARYDLLILDELGMTDCKQDGGNLLFQVISSRYERFSTIITTNLEFKDWTSIFGTQQLTNALLDRLVHRCQIIPMNGESYRFKESVRRKKKSSSTTPAAETRTKSDEPSK